MLGVIAKASHRHTKGYDKPWLIVYHIIGAARGKTKPYGRLKTAF